MPYKLTDPERQTSLDRYRGDDCSVLADEIALLRVLIEEAANARQPSLVERLTSCLARCQQAHTTAQIRAGNLIEKSKVTAICLAMAHLLSDSLQAHGITDDRHHDIIDAVIERVPATVEQFDNTPKLLEHQHGEGEINENTP